MAGGTPKCCATGLTNLISAYEAYQRDVNFSRATTIAYIAGATEIIFIMLYVLFLRRYETGQ